MCVGTYSFSKFTGDKIVERENAKGRVMVDRESYSMLNPSAYGSSKESYYDDCCCDSCMASAEIDLEDDRLDEDVSDDEGDATPDAAPAAPPAQHSHSSGETIRILEEELCLLPPTHFGFSFALRMWGQLLVKFSDIQFDDQAFDQLVLDDLPKTAIRSLVDSTRRENCKSAHSLPWSVHMVDLLVLRARPQTNRRNWSPISSKAKAVASSAFCLEVPAQVKHSRLKPWPNDSKDRCTSSALVVRLASVLEILSWCCKLKMMCSSFPELGSDAGQLETGLQKTLECASFQFAREGTLLTPIRL